MAFERYYSWQNQIFFFLVHDVMEKMTPYLQNDWIQTYRFFDTFLVSLGKNFPPIRYYSWWNRIYFLFFFVHDFTEEMIPYLMNDWTQTCLVSSILFLSSWQKLYNDTTLDEINFLFNFSFCLTLRKKWFHISWTTVFRRVVSSIPFSILFAKAFQRY